MQVKQGIYPAVSMFPMFRGQKKPQKTSESPFCPTKLFSNGPIFYFVISWLCLKLIVINVAKIMFKKFFTVLLN